MERSGALEPAAGGTALLGPDEDVPERVPAHLLHVLEAGGPACRFVQVRDPALAVERAEKRRRRVHGRLEEVDLRAQLRLQALVVEPEPRCRRQRLDELVLLGQHRVVEEGGGRPARVLDQRDVSPVRLVRQRLAFGVHVAAGLGEPVGDLERGIVQDLRERVPQRGAPRELDQQLAAAGAGEPAPQHAREERDGNEREADEQQDRERLRGVLVERLHDELHEQDQERQRPDGEHGGERPPKRGRGAAVAAADDEEDGAAEEDRGHAVDDVDRRPGRVALPDGDRAPAGFAVRVGASRARR